jgi:hypothetical protein
LAAHTDFIYSQVCQQTLAIAKNKLSQISFACLERPDSVLELCRAIVGAEVDSVDFINRAPSVDWEPTPKDINAILENNQFDRLLYDHALSAIDAGLKSSYARPRGRRVMDPP